MRPSSQPITRRRSWPPKSLRMLLIQSPKVSPRYKESTLENRHQPTHHLDARTSVLESRVIQSKVVEQFWLPRDAEILSEVLDVGLHLSLRSYLVHRALIEQEIFGRMEQVRAYFLKLQEESDA
ncbi:uncharacterized protein A4U43_C02F12960 [Asparagus officinalis]|uniref:Uncharacterized protein n=1 Tax=Asparagus officinalis TaxID=4686 RepID=A0A5P1FMY1_ASPOF|nr:uncharacterized protein A4U43_C02F12960 [Asparagus officinalis]